MYSMAFSLSLSLALSLSLDFSLSHILARSLSRSLSLFRSLLLSLSLSHSLSLPRYVSCYVLHSLALSLWEKLRHHRNDFCSSSTGAGNIISNVIDVDDDHIMKHILPSCSVVNMRLESLEA